MKFLGKIASCPKCWESTTCVVSERGALHAAPAQHWCRFRSRGEKVLQGQMQQQHRPEKAGAFRGASHVVGAHAALTMQHGLPAPQIRPGELRRPLSQARLLQEPEPKLGSSPLFKAVLKHMLQVQLPRAPACCAAALLLRGVRGGPGP